MFFSNIDDRSLAVLEQVCERYAIMAYEVFHGELAYGFKFIKYSYRDGESQGVGIFTAHFQSFPGDLHIDRTTTVTFSVRPDTGWCWTLVGGVIGSDCGESGSVEFLTETEQPHVVIKMGVGSEYRYGSGPDAKREHFHSREAAEVGLESLLRKSITVSH